MDRSDAERLHELLEQLERARAALTSLLDATTDDHRKQPVDVPDDLVDLAAFLQRSRTVMLTSPAGTRSVVSWLAEEGRRFAATDAGDEWRRRLMAAPQLGALRELWEATSVGVFDDLDESRTVPTAWIELVHDLVTSQQSIDHVIDAMRPEGLA